MFQRQFLGCALKDFFSVLAKFQMGITGAPFGPIGMKICRTAPPSRAFARGKGFRVPGGWGVGKKLKNVSFSGHFFLNFWRGMKKFDEIGQICSD